MRIASSSRAIQTDEVMQETVTQGSSMRYLKGFLVFALIFCGYDLTFSHHYDDALTAATELQGHFIQGPLSLVEFRHFVNHLWPYWLFVFFHWFKFHVSAIQLLHVWDLATASAAVMLVYCALQEIAAQRYFAFAGAFAYATAHCVWLYSGTGRLYSTSMLFAVAAYYVAFQVQKRHGSIIRLALPVVAAAFVCFASYFWLEHVFNAAAIGVMLLLLPTDGTWAQRIKNVITYVATGVCLTLVMGVSCLRYVNVPLTRSGLQTWIAGSGTQPIQFGVRGLMAAAYGQADGILATPNLLYVVHGRLLKDPAMAGLGSFAWQFAKFALVWLLLLLAYIYPWTMFRRANSFQKALILSLYVPVAINMLFGLGWLGTDVQRFLPALFPQLCLAVLSLQDWISRTARPRFLATCVVAALVVVAGVNLLEVELPTQRDYIVLEEQMKDIQPYVHSADIFVTFGKDIDNTYSTMAMHYTGASYLSLSNDAASYDWDVSDWKSRFETLWRETRERGGRVFVMDRLVSGFYPASAAWSERQHPRPTIKEYSRFLEIEFCPTPAFYLGNAQYYDVKSRSANCGLADASRLEKVTTIDFR